MCMRNFGIWLIFESSIGKKGSCVSRGKVNGGESLRKINDGLLKI